MKLIPTSRSNKKGAAAVEWAILTLMMATVGISVLFELSSSIFSTAFPRLNDPASEAGLASTPSEPGCLTFSDKADVVLAQDGIDCYSLLGGPDRFDGTSTSQNLVVTTHDTSRFTGSIMTGSGGDEITSRQNGIIASGPGDDIVVLDLSSYPLHSRYSVHLGPGNDMAAITSGRRPDGAPINSIFPGPGLTTVTADCRGNPVALKPQSGTTLRVAGPCSYNLSAESISAAEIDISDGSGLSGRLEDIERLNLSASSIFNDGADHSLTLADIEEADLALDLASVASISLSLEDIDSSSSNQVDLKLASEGGFLSFSGAAAAHWTVQLDHGADQGGIGFRFPAELGFSSMQFPSISGRTQSIRILGCFEGFSLLLDDGSVQDLAPCPSTPTAPIGLSFAQEIRLSRGGSDIALSLHALSANTLTTGAP